MYCTGVSFHRSDGQKKIREGLTIQHNDKFQFWRLAVMSKTMFIPEMRMIKSGH